MSVVSSLKSLYLSYFSKATPDRLLLQAIRKSPAKKIVSLGLGDGQRCVQIVQQALRHAPQLEFIGIDLFEGKPSPCLTVKEAHRLFHMKNLKLRLIPGDVYSALSRTANTLPHTELVLVFAGHDTAALARAWFYFPRMLAPTARVYMEETGGKESSWRQVAAEEIAKLAAQANPHARRAA